MIRRAANYHTMTADHETHLCVLCHGVMGKPENLDALRRELSAKNEVLLLVPSCYSRFRSLDGTVPRPDGSDRGECAACERPVLPTGIHVCGRRVVEEIEALVGRCPSLRYLSLLGFSLGGLVAHFVAGELLRRNFLGADICLKLPWLGLTTD